MIARLEGRLLEIDGTRVLLDVAGVGYEVDVTTGLLGGQPALGSTLVLFTHQVIREDGHFLFGFASRAEREMFRALIKVSGIGPKLALALLSGMPLAALASAVANEEVARLTKISGVGRKTAERLVVELRDKLGAMVPSSAGSALPADAPAAARLRAEDAEAALIALGYRPVEATRWVSAVFVEGLAVEELVRLALRAAGEGRQ
jgi:Holliday junction DNA helicase RuvA